MVIDLNGIRDGTGPARLLDIVQGRPKQAFKRWLAAREKSWRDGVKVVAMDGLTGFKTAVAEELPKAVMDAFHVVRLAGETLGWRLVRNPGSTPLCRLSAASRLYRRPFRYLMTDSVSPLCFCTATASMSA